MNPLVGDPEITAVLIFCDDSGQLGCCYPHYIRENEDAGRVTKMSPDRLVEVWTEEGTTFAVRRG